MNQENRDPHASPDPARELRTRAQLRAIGRGDAEIRAYTDAHRLVRVWPGRYRAAGPLPAEEEFLLMARAAAENSGVGLVLSHGAAAVLHGLETLHPDYDSVDFTAPGRSGGRRSGRRRVHMRRLDAEDVAVVEGLACTAIARTALDLVLAGTYEQGICVLDSARRLGVPQEDLVAAAARLGRRNGADLLRAVLPRASALPQSLGESYSRALMHKWPEIPEPALQREFRGETGELLCVPDFEWRGVVAGGVRRRVQVLQRRHGGGAVQP
ncbi:hypothetical protein [Tsukamurella sp. 1534]|uniref:hypothetical protein n=1 Tax=Tsukamurella sp. 1534 TaxID=1151061 RepID=UPI00030F3A5B|nr:hypothetical protein [Tsukamurella sp. 1534]